MMWWATALTIFAIGIAHTWWYSKRGWVLHYFTFMGWAALAIGIVIGHFL